MTEVASQLARLPGLAALRERAPASLNRLLSMRERLLPEASDYQAAAKGLYVASAIAIVLVGTLPLYGPQKHILLVQQTMYYGLIALSLNLLVSTTGLISFGHAMFLGFGAYMV